MPTPVCFHGFTVATRRPSLVAEHLRRAHDHICSAYLRRTGEPLVPLGAPEVRARSVLLPLPADARLNVVGDIVAPIIWKADPRARVPVWG